MDTVLSSYALSSGRPRRVPVPCTVNTVLPESTVLSTTISYNGLQSPPPSASNQRRFSAFSTCSLEPSLSNGSGSAPFTPELRPNTMPGIFEENPALYMGPETTHLRPTSVVASLPDKGLQYNTVDSFPYSLDDTYRAANLSLTPVDGNDTFDPFTSSYLDAYPTNKVNALYINNAHQTWQASAMQSQSRQLDNVSFAEALFPASGAAQSNSASTSFSSDISNLLAPATSSFCSSGPGSAFGTHFDSEHHQLEPVSVVPSQAFQNETPMSQHSHSYETYSVLSTPLPKYDVSTTDSMLVSPPSEASMSPFANTYQLPWRPKEEYASDNESSPKRRTSRRSNTRRSRNRSLKTRDRKRTSKTKTSGLSYNACFKDEALNDCVVDVNIDNKLHMDLDGTIHIKGEIPQPHCCEFMLLNDRGHPVQCGKRFKRREHLGRHQISHGGEKRFACLYYDKCDKAVSRHDNWVDHMMTHNKAFFSRGSGSTRARNRGIDPDETRRVLIAEKGVKEADQTMASIRHRLENWFKDDPSFQRRRKDFDWLA